MRNFLFLMMFGLIALVTAPTPVLAERIDLLVIDNFSPPDEFQVEISISVGVGQSEADFIYDKLATLQGTAIIANKTEKVPPRPGWFSEIAEMKPNNIQDILVNYYNIL